MSRRVETILLAVGLTMVFISSSRADERILHTERSLYRNITVYESNDERCMRFTKQGSARQTCMSLKDPDALVFDYTKAMLGALYLQPNPRKILIVGLGGGTLPSALSRLYPNAEIDAVEIDPAVVRVAQHFFGFRTTQRMRVIEEDGRVFVKRAGKKGVQYDLVMLDAFEHDYIPEHLLTQEFLKEVRAVLAPEGVLAANTWSSSRLYDHESTTYESVFGRFYNLRKGNRIILLKKDELPSIGELKSNAALLEKRLKPYGVRSSRLLPLFSTNRDWRTGARILTDQYSPSNLLNEPSR